VLSSYIGKDVFQCHVTLGSFQKEGFFRHFITSKRAEGVAVRGWLFPAAYRYPSVKYSRIIACRMEKRKYLVPGMRLFMTDTENPCRIWMFRQGFF
jgi:hypothetical protein